MSASAYARPLPTPDCPGVDAPQQASAQNVSDVAAARAALAAGQYEEAARRASVVLERGADNQAAAAIKVSALLAQNRVAQALSAYDAYVGARQTPDTQVLASIGRATIGQSLQNRKDDPVFQATALERLARAGDDDALVTLRSIALSSTPDEAFSSQTLAPLVSLARLGNEEAVAKLASLLETVPQGSTFIVIQAIENANARTLGSNVALLLDDSRPIIRGLAALAVGTLGYQPAVGRLRALLDDPVAIVRLDAALGLKRLGDHAADDVVASLLKSPSPESRLMAARSCPSAEDDEWVAPITELLSDPNEMNRVRAADLLARHDPSAARSALLAAIDSPTGVVRAEAARILEERGLADPQIARRLLGDPLEVVRLHGAASALRSSAPR